MIILRATTFLSTLVLSAQICLAQTPDYQKLAQACKVWGIIKYFHPDEPSFKFDSAFAAQIPTMLKAKSEEDWINAYRDWFSILKDPATNIIKNSNNIPDVMLKEISKDSILIVKLDGTSFFKDRSAVSKFFTSLLRESQKVRGIIFDLRQSEPNPPDQDGFLNAYFESLGLNSSFGNPLFIPKFQSVYYSGFVPENGYTSGDYFKAITQKNSFELPKGEIQKTTVWILNKYSELPLVALSQQVAGNGFIINDSESIRHLLPVTQSLPFNAQYSIKFTTQNIVMNSSNDLQADLVYSDINQAMELAQKYVLVGKSSGNRKPERPTQRTRALQYAFPNTNYPDVGYRIVAAAKIFTIIEYFFPYYQMMERDWHEVFIESLPEFVEAVDEEAYGFAVAKMYANIQDSHGNVTRNKFLNHHSSLAPFYVDWIEEKIVVTHFRNDSLCRAKGINKGDVIVKVNSRPVNEIMNRIKMYVSSSSPQAFNQMAAQTAVRGKEGEKGLFTIQNSKGKIYEVELEWRIAHNRKFQMPFKLDTLTLINNQLGYADLTRMKTSQIDEMFEKFKYTKGIIFDMRGYPDLTPRSIAPRLTEKKDVSAALFRKPEILVPNLKNGDILSQRSSTEFIQTMLVSDKWKYKGRTIMLINQRAMSRAEHTALFFESVNNTTFIGTPTTGANGDVTNFSIPGGMQLAFSGEGVWHADGRPLQRIGIQPHVLVKPTIRGIRQGKDEVLDKAIEWAQGDIISKSK